VNDLKYSEDDSTPEDETKNILSSVRNLPERYKIREHDNKKFLMCLEAPNIRVQEEFDDVKDVKELARIEFGDNRIAVVVETQLGIYELEAPRQVER